MYSNIKLYVITLFQTDFHEIYYVEVPMYLGKTSVLVLSIFLLFELEKRKTSFKYTFYALRYSLRMVWRRTSNSFYIRITRL